MTKPSPDWDLVTLKWAGSYLDGKPATGSLKLTYNGGIMLDDDPVAPLSIYPQMISVPLTTKAIVVDGEPREVGYAEVQVPASNDPDIQGAGGTYTLAESLNAGGGRSGITFVADINAPGGVIWLNKIIPTKPAPGVPLSVVYYSDFTALGDRVTALEAGGTSGGGTGGGVTSYNDLTDRPTIPTKPADIGAQPAGAYAEAAHTHATADVAGLDSALDGKQPAGSYAPATHTHTAAQLSDATATGRSVLTAASAAAARTAIGAGTSSLTVGTSAGTAKAGDYQPAWTEVTSKPTTFAPTAHSHAVADVTGLQVALDGKATVVTLTQAAYDALGTKSPATLYVVTG